MRSAQTMHARDQESLSACFKVGPTRFVDWLKSGVSCFMSCSFQDQNHWQDFKFLHRCSTIKGSLIQIDTQPANMARPASAPALILLACVALALRNWLGSAFQGESAFTVVGSSPEGFAPPAQAPRAEIPQAPSAGKLGGSAGVGGAAEEMFNRHEFLRRRDMGHKYPVGEEAYQFPPPIPDKRAGLNFPSTLLGHCDRVYRRKWRVCARLGENKRRRSDCEWDAFRWRRTCYWKARPNTHKIHPNFDKRHPWHNEA